MKSKHHSRHSRWWRGFSDPKYFPNPPPWWPENEPWPPMPRYDKKEDNSYFFHRLGCALFFSSIFILLVVGGLIWLIADRVSLKMPPVDSVWIYIISGVVLLMIVRFFIWGGRAFRRFSGPLEDLFNASKRVAEGDYTVRVRERGTKEVRALVRAFNSMASHLQIDDEQRRSLLADVTHELRTPLTVMRGNIEGMLDGIYSADEARLKSILDEVHVLTRLVDDLRTLVLAESGALQLHKEASDFAALLGDAAAAFQTQADDLDVELRIDVAPGMQPVQLDAERMHQVLSNLIVNALRYTPAGGQITLRGKEARGANGARRVLITVEDTGPGIKAQDLPYVFERFYKASDSGGMGLGLAIVKNIVAAHGGTVSVSSQEGKGTQFSISLPD